MLFFKLALLFLVLFQHVHILAGKTVEGAFHTEEVDNRLGLYIAKFCFYGSTATLKYSFNVTRKDAKFHFFMDEVWQTVSKIQDCREKYRNSAATYSANRSFGNISVASSLETHIVHIIYTDTDTCHRPEQVRSQPGGKYVGYNVQLLNSDSFGSTTDHFSKEESGLLEFYGFCVLIYFILGCITAPEIYHTMTKHGPMNLVLKMLSSAMVLQFFGLILMLLHLYRYSDDGVGLPLAEKLAELLDVMSQFQMLYMLLSLSLGWTLGSSHLVMKAAVWKSKPATVSAAFLAVLQAVLLMWEQYEDSEHRTYHSHQSMAGLLLVVIRLLLALILAGNLYFTVSAERSTLRKDFYRTFAKACIFWFICYPIIAALSLLAACYIRYKFITVGVTLCQFVAVLMLYKLFLSRNLYWEVSALSSQTLTLPLRIDKTLRSKIYS